MSLRALASFRRVAAAALMVGGFALVAPLGASAQTDTPAPAPAATTYTVKWGDYLYGIARANGVSLNALLAANGLTANSMIRPGQVLQIPAPGTTPAAPAPATPTAPAAGSGTYTVVRGDSLYGISRKTGTAFNTLLSINGLTARSLIMPGQVLKTSGSAPSTPAPATPTPAPATPPAASGTYTVARGDSLYAIASKTGTPFNTLLSINGLSASSMIHPGQVLKTAASTSAPSTPAPGYTPPANGLPANSGTGRRLVFSLSQQRVWAVSASGAIERTWLVSGRLNLPSPGTYSVFSRSLNSFSNADPATKFRYMVRFTKGPQGDNIGFHEIPTRYGVPQQSTSQLGQPISAGCLRQATGDAQFVWNWAPIGTRVVVTR